MYHSDFFDHKRHSALLDRIVRYRTWLVRHKSAKGVDRLDPNTRYKQNSISGVDKLDPNTRYKQISISDQNLNSNK